MPTYYMRADGTAANKAAATSDAAAATSMSITTHNGETFAPGDTIIISDAGGVYSGALVPTAGFKVPSSGASGNPITYLVSGDPVISKSTVKTGWVASGTGNVWKVGHGSAVNQLWIDATFGTQKSGATLASIGDWVWDQTGVLYDAAPNYLYLYSTSDPDSAFTTVDVTIASSSYIFDFNAKSNITLDATDGSLTLKKAYHSCITSDSAGGSGQSNLTIKGVTVEWAQRNGVILSGVTTALIEDCIGRYCGRHGVYCALGSYNTIRRCETLYNGTYQPVAFDSDLQWTAGIKCWGGNEASSLDNLLCENNNSHHNGPVGGVGSNYGTGIWLDLCNGIDRDNANVVRFNRIADNEGDGLYIEKSLYSDVYGNLIVRNALNIDQNNVYVDAKLGKDCSYNLLYNNTIANGYIGLRVVGDNVNGAEINYNEFKNNIVSGNSSRELWGNFGGENATYGTGNRYINNCFGAEGGTPAFIIWSGTTYTDLSTWESAANAIEAGTASANVEGDPAFKDAANDKFWLAVGSPCLGAGVNLGGDYKAGLHKASTWPDGVRTVNQSGLWDMGAYVSETATGAAALLTYFN